MRNSKSYLRPLSRNTLTLGMALDPLEFAKTLERLRMTRGQSKDKAADFIGMSPRNYRKYFGKNPPVARLSTVEKVADAYGVPISELIGEVTHTNGTLTDRLQRLEDQAAATAQAVQEILQLLRDEILPALPEPQPRTATTSARGTRTKGRQARAS